MRVCSTGFAGFTEFSTMVTPVKIHLRNYVGNIVQTAFGSIFIRLRSLNIELLRQSHLLDFSLNTNVLI